MDKPEILYIGSPIQKIKEILPKKGNHRGENEGAVVFATPDKALASVFMIKNHNDSWMEIGYFNDELYTVICMDKEEFLEKDNGGSIYEVSSNNFKYNPNLGMGEKEWTSDKPTKPIKETFHNSVLDTMIDNRVNVYFVRKNIFENIKNSPDHGWSILNNLSPESKNLITFPKNEWEDIRKRLDEIILKNNTENWWDPELFIKNTLNILPKEIEVLEIPPKSENNYNCFIYTLGLPKNKEIIKESKGFIYDSFFLKLLEEKKLKYIESPEIGDFIIYRDLEKYPDLITHTGIICKNNKIISKWAWGPLVKHNIFDVPQSYGNDISYAKSISKDKAEQLYLKYKKFNKKI